MNRFVYWSLIFSVLGLCACETNPAKNPNPGGPSAQTFQTTPEFLDSLLKLDGEERSECLENLIAQVSEQIALSGSKAVAETLDSNLEIEINENCSIKRK